MDKNLFKFLFGVRPEDLPENVILTPFLSPKCFVSYCEIREFFKGKLYSGAVCREKGKDFGVIRCGIGAGIAGDSVIGLERTAVKNLVFIGSAGALNHAKIGDIIVADSAYDGEGFSGYHKDNGCSGDLLKSAVRIEPDPGLSGRIERKIKENIYGGEVLKRGRIFTIGSLTAETEQRLRELERMGFLGVEMELSAVFQAALKVCKKAAGVLFVSDEPLIKPLWKELEKEDRKKYNHSMDIVVRNIVDLFTAELI